MASTVSHQKTEISWKTVQALLRELKTCARTQNLRRGKQIHEEAIKCGHDSSIYVTSALINMYAKCCTMDEARQVFEHMKHPNAASWNALISGYAENGKGLTSLKLFTRLPEPNSVSFVAALKACAALATAMKKKTECRNWGKSMHNLAVEHGCDSSIYVQNMLIDMYSKCSDMLCALQVFDSMEYTDVVTWTALILGYAANGQSHTALKLLRRMRTEGPVPDARTLVAALKACTSHAGKGDEECRQQGRLLHNIAVENGCDSDVFVQNSLMDMYAKCGCMADARQVFDRMKRLDVVSWTTVISGYAENGDGLSALSLFTRMRIEGPEPNSVTFMACLKACGLVGALEFGRVIQSQMDADLTVVLVTCLVDFYAKCGSLLEARTLFDLHAEKTDVVTWNALMAGFTDCGDYRSVFGLFREMQDARFQPDSVTFLTVLACCSHAGLVEKGKACFEAMPKYGLVPGVEHYNCLGAIFGRANKLDDVMALLRGMPCSPDEVTWKSALSACRKSKNVATARLAFQSLIGLHEDSAAYVVMGQIFESRGMLQEQELVLGMRKASQAWQRPQEACWTNELGEVHSFEMSSYRL